MRSILYRVAGIVTLAAAGLWMYAQTASATRRLAELVPPGALLFVEARDLQTLLKDWNQSQEKQVWLRSANYQSFLRSKLLLRLGEVQTGYGIPKLAKSLPPAGQQARAAAAPAALTLPDMQMLESAAGAESAVALYDIGKLEFLYVTRMPSTRLAASVLWQARDQFESRTAAGQQYYLKSFDQGTLAFATSGDFLLVATREDLLGAGLSLIAGRSNNSLAGESWFSGVVAKATQPTPDLRLAVNQERINRAPHFQSYWIQDSALTGNIRSIVSDLKLDAGEWRETRVMLREEAAADERSAEAATADVAARVPANAGFVEAFAKPSESRVRELILEKILGAGGPNSPAEPARYAPGESYASSPGSEDDLEVVIDRATDVASGGNPVLAAIAPLTGNIEAVAFAGRSRATGDRVFSSIDHGVVLRRPGGWTANEVRAAMRSAVAHLVSTSSTGVDWVARNNGAALNGLKPVFLAVAGNDLILSNSVAFGEELAAAPAAGASRVEPASYIASYAHAQEFPGFERMTSVMDYPSVPRNQPVDNRAPLFFSENVASLGRVLTRMDRASITVHDDGSQMTQTVVYKRRN